MVEQIGLPRPQAAPSNHPAVQAWRRLQIEPAEIGEISVLKQRFKSSIYRIQCSGPKRFSIVAKFCQRHVAAQERVIYEDILPSLPVPAPRYYGFVAGDSDYDYDWLFIEYVEGELYSREHRGHALLAGRWLGFFHAFSARVPAARGLPDLGPAHYLAQLRIARGRLRSNLKYLKLPLEDSAVVRAVILQCDFLESHWGQIEQWCSRMPRTLVHGDFKPRNVLIRTAADGAVLLPFDWEASGWGVPAEDLAYIDLAAYQATVQPFWPDVNSQDLQRMKAVGRIFRGLSEFSWESVKFDPQWEVSVVKLRVYQVRMAEAIEMVKWGE